MTFIKGGSLTAVKAHSPNLRMRVKGREGGVSVPCQSDTKTIYLFYFIYNRVRQGDLTYAYPKIVLSPFRS